jgi:hypothetical protein
MLGIIVILNLVDAIATMFWIEIGIAEEGNPMMRWVLDDGVGNFIFIKTILVFLSALLLWRLKDFIFARILTIPVFILYCYIALVHTFVFLEIIFQNKLFAVL